MPSTKENLETAFAGESQANQKYLAFAKKADAEGLPNIARLFRTTADAEKLHAEGHLKAMEKLGSTVENLTAAIDGETYEFSDMYPPMLEQAKSEGHKAKRMFAFAIGAEKVHADLYKQALERASVGEDLPDQKYFLCPVCGHIEFGSPPDSCPVCGAPATQFIEA